MGPHGPRETSVTTHQDAVPEVRISDWLLEVDGRLLWPLARCVLVV